jgi:hypothetical protein
LIDTREPWREEKEHPDDPSRPMTRPLVPERADTIVHTEKGSVHCICPHTGVQRASAFQGFEADRNALKYRCPAATDGLECRGRDACHRAGGVSPGDYGRIVRISLHDHDRRIFVPTPYGSPSWQRGYNRRSALERINNRIDNGFGFERHFIRGRPKMTTRVGLALAVMMAMALGVEVFGSVAMDNNGMSDVSRFSEVGRAYGARGIVSRRLVVKSEENDVTSPVLEGV